MALPLLGAGSGSGTILSPWASFDGSNSNATITNLGLTATHSNSTFGGARSASAKSSGLYYFELTMTTVISTSCAGLLTAAGTYTNIVVNGTNCVAIYQSGGAIWSNGANSTKSLGSLSNGDIIGIAMNFGNAKVWVRKSPSGNWNGDVAANPATNTNGISTSNFSATTLAPAVGWSNASGGDVTANFGLGAFSGTVPSGFTAGWPV